MKIKSILLSAGILVSSLTATAKEATFKANPDLVTALKHVDTDGESLSISNDKEFLEDMAKYYDMILTPIFEMSEETQRLSLKEMLNVMGLDGITSTASSCKKYEGHYINKYFIQTSSQHKGLWSLWGKANQATVAQTFAPAETNLLLETQLNSQQLYQMIVETLKMVNPQAAEETVRNMNAELPALDITIKELLAKIDSRVSIVSTIDFQETFKDLQNKPQYKVTARIDRVAKILWPLVEPELAKIGEIQTEGNQHSIDFPEIPTELGPLMMTLHFDLDNDYIWLTTDKKHLKVCQDDKAPKLASNQSYIDATSKLPKTGCAQLYVSKALTSDLVKVAVKSIDLAGDKEPMPSMKKLMLKLQPTLSNSHGICWIAQKNKDGVLSTSNTPFRIRGGMMQYLVLTSSMASIATPLILQKRKDADRVKNVGHMTQLKLAIVMYEDEFGELPAKLGDLAKLKTVHPASIARLTTMNTDQGKQAAVYIFRKNPKGNDIILHTPSPIDGRHVILKYDGSVAIIQAGQLERLLK